MKMTHHIQEIKKGVETKKKKPRKSDQCENTRVFLYMGGGADSRKMQVQVTYFEAA
jgi:hypothetical protein